MKLKTYLDTNKLRPSPWAIKNGISPAVISRYLNGRNISSSNALKLEFATGGAVTLRELLAPGAEYKVNTA